MSQAFIALGANLGDPAATIRAAFEALLANNLAQPKVFVHRDYHSRNLMASEPPPGVKINLLTSR